MVFTAIASRVLTALQTRDTLAAGFNCINALASLVLTALQPCGTLLSQCDILIKDACPGKGQQVQHGSFIQVYNNAILLHKKIVSYAVNSHVLTGANPYINKAIQLCGFTHKT